jgi:peptide/nickel transport system permease protein
MGYRSTGRAIAAVCGRRLVQALLVALVVIVVSFFMMRALPGDPAYRIASARYGEDQVSTAAAERVRAELRLDDPWPQALGGWLARSARLDLGISFVTGAPVVREIQEQLGHTLVLSAVAMFASLLIGPPLGAWLGWRAGSRLDRAVRLGAVFIKAIPPFLIGVVLVVAFSIQFASLPAAGHADATSVILPALTLAIGLAAGSCRVTRDAMQRVGGSEYLMFARTKGLSERDTFVRHGLRNAAAPVVAYLGIQLVFLIEGVIAVETLFAWPGIGHALVHAVFGRDIPMIQGTALVMALMFVTLNALVDVATVAIDPRRR